jgi:S1/P1 Nuclease
MKLIAVACAGVALTVSCAGPACAWGDEGHEVIGLIADHYLTPPVRARVQSLLAADDSALVSRDIAHEATWADKYRDSDRGASAVRYIQTRDWHFVDLEMQSPDLNGACHGRPPLAAGAQASDGPAQDCVIDKIEQFSAELKNTRTDARERRLALQFLLHFVGDVHQPLHAGDDNDLGGNRKIVSGPGLRSGNLHHDWDTEFVKRLGSSPAAISDRLIADITGGQRRQWSRGSALEWAEDSYRAAKQTAYGGLPAPDARGRYRLSESYETQAIAATAEQLSKAGVRLAYLLNRDLE